MRISREKLECSCLTINMTDCVSMMTSVFLLIVGKEDEKEPLCLTVCQSL